MKKFLLISLALASGSVFAHGIDLTNPFNHATRPELAKETAERIEGDKANAAALAAETKARKDADTQLGYEINTQAKYTTSVNEDLQASKAAGAAAYNQIQGQISDTNSAIGKVDADSKARDTALGSRIDQTNKNVTQVDTDSKARDAALGTKIDANAAAQAGVNTKVQGQIGDLNKGVATAQSTADTAFANTLINDSNIRKVNDLANRTADVVELHDGQIKKNASDIYRTQHDVTNLQTSDKVQNGQIQNQIKVTNAHTQTLIDHDARISGTEQVNARQDVQLGQHQQAINEYGQRLDVQDALNSRFEGDLGNLRGQVAGMNDRINSADRKAERALNAAAGALSVAAIQFDTNVEAGFQVGAAAATLAGKNAVAIGAGGALNKNWFVSGYATQAGSASGGAVSATYSFGR